MFSPSVTPAGLSGELDGLGFVNTVLTYTGEFGPISDRPPVA